MNPATSVNGDKTGLGLPLPPSLNYWVFCVQIFTTFLRLLFSENKSCAFLFSTANEKNA